MTSASAPTQDRALGATLDPELDHELDHDAASERFGFPVVWPRADESGR